MKAWNSVKSKQAWMNQLMLDMSLIHSLLHDLMNDYFRPSKSDSEKKTINNQLIAVQALNANMPGEWDFITLNTSENTLLSLQEVALELQLPDECPIVLNLQWTYHIQWENLVAKWLNEIKQILITKNFAPDKNLIYGCHFDAWLKKKIEIELARRQEWYLILALGNYAAYCAYQDSDTKKAAQAIQEGDFAKKCLRRLGILHINLPAIPSELMNHVNTDRWELTFQGLIEAVWDKFEIVERKNNEAVYHIAPAALAYHPPEPLHTTPLAHFYNKEVQAYTLQDMASNPISLEQFLTSSNRRQIR